MGITGGFMDMKKKYVYGKLGYSKKLDIRRKI